MTTTDRRKMSLTNKLGVIGTVCTMITLLVLLGLNLVSFVSWSATITKTVEMNKEWIQIHEQDVNKFPVLLSRLENMEREIVDVGDVVKDVAGELKEHVDADAEKFVKIIDRINDMNDK